MKVSCFKNKEKKEKLLKTVDFLKIIAEENRLKIFCILKDGEKCVCEIWQKLDLPQNLTSHHLKVLKDHKLINSHKDGLKVFYAINKKEVTQYSKILNKLLNIKNKQNYEN